MNMKEYAIANDLLKELAVWKMMRDRCYNPNNCSYNSFGGKGIKVCKEWDSNYFGFQTFIEDMGKRPKDEVNGVIKHVLARKDENKDFEPSNCYWKDKEDEKNLFPLGMSTHPLAHVYVGMIQRCFNSTNVQYKDYGGKGITVCDRWREEKGQGFLNWLEDMGPRPEGEYESGYSIYSIERRDNDGNYCPENCYWADRRQQNINRKVPKKYKSKYNPLGI